MYIVLARMFAQRLKQCSLIEINVVIGLKLRCRYHVAIDHDMARAGSQGLKCLRPRSHNQIATQQQIGGIGPQSRGVQTSVWGRDADVAQHRTALLRHAGHVHHATGLSVDVRRHTQNRSDGQHAGATDARQQNIVGTIARCNCRNRQGAE